MRIDRRWFLIVPVLLIGLTVTRARGDRNEGWASACFASASARGCYLEFPIVTLIFPLDLSGDRAAAISPKRPCSDCQVPGSS
jgi:hypothetical protein